jgi:hypothetical protein
MRLSVSRGALYRPVKSITGLGVAAFSALIVDTKPIFTSSVSNNGITISNMACQQMVCLRSKVRFAEARGDRFLPRAHRVVRA